MVDYINELDKQFSLIEYMRLRNRVDYSKIDNVFSSLKRYPKAKIISATRNFFYREILDDVVIHGENLKSALKPRSKCAILCDSGLNATIAILACWYADMIAIPLSESYGQDHCNKIISLYK